MPLVLHERTVLVETVFAGNVFEFGPEPVHGHLQLVRILPQDAAHGHDAALPDLVRPGRGAFVGHIRREMVHRTEPGAARATGRRTSARACCSASSEHRSPSPTSYRTTRPTGCSGSRSPSPSRRGYRPSSPGSRNSATLGPVSGGQRIEFGEVAAHHHRNGVCFT